MEDKIDLKDVALAGWRQTKGYLEEALAIAEKALSLHPSPVPERWVGVIPRLRELVEDFQAGTCDTHPYLLFQLHHRHEDGTHDFIAQAEFPDIPETARPVAAWIEDVKQRHSLSERCEWFVCNERDPRFVWAKGVQCEEATEGPPQDGQPSQEAGQGAQVGD